MTLNPLSDMQRALLAAFGHLWIHLLENRTIMSMITPPLKWHGGKSYLARRIVALMPPRCKNPNAPAADDPGWLHYVEPYAGGLAVLLENDPEGISEVANDLNKELVHFWATLADEVEFAAFQRVLEATPFCEATWESSGMDGAGIQRAVAFFIRCRQSLAGRMKGFAGITRNRTRRGMNEQVSAWWNAIEGLPAVHERLKRVAIFNRPALDVIRGQDGPRTLFYLDPPYLHSTRATTGEYQHEMNHAEHGELLRCLATIEGRFMLSGYRSDLYDEAASMNGWTRHDFEIPNQAAGGKTKRRMTESVWCNF